MSNDYNPYNVGLLLGSEADFVLTNINSEPVAAETVLKDNGSIEGWRTVGEHEDDVNRNHYKVKRHMVRIYSANTHCRAWAIDNIWHSLKSVVVDLRKRAFISYHQSYIDQDDQTFSAGGRLRMTHNHPGIYAGDGEKILAEALDVFSDNKYATALRRNLLLIPGLINLLLDRRPSAELRRKIYGPDTDKCYRKDGRYILFQPLTNFWLYHPSITHLIFGATRVAFYITINDLSDTFMPEEEIVQETIEKVFSESDYERAEQLWNQVKVSVVRIYPHEDSPFSRTLNNTIEFIGNYGIGVLGPGVYANWRLNRKKSNYCGHLSDLVGWEDHVYDRIFHEKHPLYDEYREFIKR